ETSLTYYKARYYDSVLAQFVAADPSDPTDPRVGVNRYAYALQDPIDFTDNGNRAGGYGTAEVGVAVGRAGLTIGTDGNVYGHGAVGSYGAPVSVAVTAGGIWTFGGAPISDFLTGPTTNVSLGFMSIGWNSSGFSIGLGWAGWGWTESNGYN